MINAKKYIEENPTLWAAFVKYTKWTKGKGFQSYSAKGIFELIRWHTGVKGNDSFKVNNNYTADFARKMMEEYPEFKGFFRLRETKAARPS